MILLKARRPTVTLTLFVADHAGNGFSYTSAVKLQGASIPIGSLLPERK